MEHRDYLQRQFDRLGKALANALSKLYGFDSSARLSEGMELLNEVLMEELDLDLDGILIIADEAFINYLLNELRVSHSSMEKLAEVMVLMSKNGENGQNLLKKSLLIYEFLQVNSETYSLERAALMERIKNELDQDTGL